MYIHRYMYMYIYIHIYVFCMYISVDICIEYDITIYIYIYILYPKDVRLVALFALGLPTSSESGGSVSSSLTSPTSPPRAGRSGQLRIIMLSEVFKKEPLEKHNLSQKFYGIHNDVTEFVGKLRGKPLEIPKNLMVSCKFSPTKPIH